MVRVRQLNVLVKVRVWLRLGEHHLHSIFHFLYVEEFPASRSDLGKSQILSPHAAEADGGNVRQSVGQPNIFVQGKISAATTQIAMTTAMTIANVVSFLKQLNLHDKVQ